MKSIDLYHEMLRIRLIEEAIAEHYAEGEMRCPVHLSIGQEAIAVGVCAALSQTDKVYSTHRSHAHYLAKGGDLNRMLAEIYGKSTGCIGGRGGSMHLMDNSVGMMASVPIVASSIPLAVGCALASKRSGSKDVTVVFIGDASVEEGAFHESANFAALYELPVIFVCENNLYSVYTPLDQRQPDRPISKLAEAHGVFSQQGNGNDAEGVFDLAAAAVQRAREGGGPSFLLFDTYRWLEHCGPNYDNDIGYRSEEEYLEWAAGCPVKSLEQRLIGEGSISEADVSAFTAGVSEEITAAMQHAKEAPLPTPEDSWRHVYA